jgi:hypothetical protein
MLPCPTVRSHRAIRHSHTQTHGTHRRLQRLQRHLVDNLSHTDISVPVDCAVGNALNTFDCMWPDTATNATQTVASSFPDFFESADAHAPKNYNNGSVDHAVLFNNGSWIPGSTDFSSSADILDVDDGKCAKAGNMPHSLTSNDERSVNQVIGTRSISGELARCHENELFHSTRDVSVQFDQLLDELVASAAAPTSSTGAEHPNSSSLSRLMLTSASQTVPIDFDVVATQTMECDFDAVDFDFANTETQTTSDLLDAYFGFSDIETQTVQDLQLWDSQTQTCFDSLI